MDKITDQSLKNKTITGLFWNGIDKFGIKGTAFVIGIILARILMPTDYGLIGMLSIFIAFSDLFVGSGLSLALIQKTDRTDIDYSTIFHFNLLVGLTCYLILFLSAPLIALFFNTPQLVMLTRVLALVIIINALALVQQTRLTINLDFKTQAIVSLFSVVTGGAIGVFLAYNGFGVWSLVTQMLSSSIVRAASLFHINKWMPMLTFSGASFKKLFGFSSKLLAAGFVATIINNLYSILIGKIFSPKDLGYYTKAKEYPELLSATLSTVLQGVSFPILASLQDDRDRMVSVYSRMMGMVVFFVLPAMTLFALLCKPFIRFFLTEKWLPIVPLLQWMCFARMITPISSLNMNILNAIGRSDLFFFVDISKLPLTITTLIITIPLGLKAVVIGHCISSFIAYFINAYFPGKLFDFGAIRQIKDMQKTFCATLIMSVVVYFSILYFSSDLTKLLIGILIGLCSYIMSAYVLKIKELDDVYSIVKSYMRHLRCMRDT